MKPERIPHPYPCEMQIANLRAARSGRTYEVELETLLSGKEWTLPPPPPPPPPPLLPEQIEAFAAIDAADEKRKRQDEEKEVV